METIKELFILLAGSALVSEIVLSRFLSYYPFLNATKKVQSAGRIGAVLMFVVTIITALDGAIGYYVLMPYGMEYLSLMSSVIVSLTIVILAEKFIKRFMKKLYQYIRDYYSIVTMNGIALALVISEMQFSEPVMETVISAALVTGGFAIALLILAGIRERMERNSLPAYFKGMPIALLVMSLILMVLDGLESLF